MTYNDYYDSLSSSEKLEFADRLGTNKVYLSQLRIGYRKPGRSIISKICKASGGSITIQEMYDE